MRGIETLSLVGEVHLEALSVGIFPYDLRFYNSTVDVHC